MVYKCPIKFWDFFIYVVRSKLFENYPTSRRENLHMPIVRQNIDYINVSNIPKVYDIFFNDSLIFMFCWIFISIGVLTQFLEADYIELDKNREVLLNSLSNELGYSERGIVIYVLALPNRQLATTSLIPDWLG